MVDAKSRRTLLRGVAVAPIPTMIMVSPWDEKLAALNQQYDDEPARLERTKRNRSLSRSRYHKAEHWAVIMDAGFLAGPDCIRSVLHVAGFVAQQALEAYFLDIGFAGEWIARRIGQDVAKALSYANATGFGHHRRDMARLAVVLSPYCKWGRPFDPSVRDQPDIGHFVQGTISPLVHDLLDHVQAVTGHSRPKGCVDRRRAQP